MGLKDCKIVLDNPWNVYHPGETITGHVNFTFDSVKKVRGIYIGFKGYSETTWVEQRASKTKVNVTCHGREEYFKQTYYLLGDLVGFYSRKIEILAGTHKYPFTCALPPTLPSSFEGEFGYVRYTIKVTLERPWKFDQETKMGFTIVNHFDLNLISDYMLPTSVHMDETFCCQWCSSSSLIVNVSTPLSGYCSGQEMPLDILCDNKSNVDVSLITVALRQVVQYMCQIPMHEVKIVRKEICQVILGCVKSKSKKNWKKSLRIPPLPPSSLKHCNLIDIHYDIKVKCMHSGIHPDIKEKSIITIGTVPIVNSTQDNITSESTNTPCNINNSMIMLYPKIGYPQYEDGLYTAPSILEQHESPLVKVQHSTNFVPKYPTYKYSMTQ